jgi:hypothetical protein
MAGGKRFRLVRCLGAGGMGEVFEALDQAHDTRVALKLLSKLSADALLRFKNEFRALQDLDHPNLVSLGELLEDTGVWFFTMEFVDGVDLLSWVRPGGTEDVTELPTAKNEPLRSGRLRAPLTLGSASLPSFDEGRLRDALRQLARGLSALHRSGKVHRDVKPSNVLVTREGRLVLLDFGLVRDIEQPADRVDGDKILGTPAFMAPEQATGTVGPAADWYATGVVLFLALTGRLPFAGEAREVLEAKQLGEPPPPRRLVPGVPPDLDRLCVELLRTHPAARPSGREILARLGVVETPSTHSSSLSDAPFVGRDRELGELQRAFDDVGKGRALTVCVRGESGIGKTALVRQLIERLRGDARVLVLAGRCYESESVPFKGIDGVVDALSHHLAALPRNEVEARLPQRAGRLVQVFPVLRQVEAIAEARMASQEVLDPQELRARVFAGLRELLARIAVRQPLVIAIDDLQWTDVDSLALLREVLRPPDAPAILLLCTVRDEPGVTDFAQALPGEVRTLRLVGLPPAEARLLAGRLMGTRAVTQPATVAAIASEAGGHPLFIDELVRHALAEGGHAPGRLLLEEALWTRISRLDGPLQEVLELMALGGGPMLKETLARAAAVDFGEFSKHALRLRLANLVRVSGAHADSLELLHDRVRESVLAHLAETRRQVLHRRLAVTLEASGRAEPEALAVQWRGAGESVRAVRYLAMAGDQAAGALAFDRAARLYGQARELRPERNAETRGLSAKLARALANAGRGAEAADAYLHAAEGANAAESLDLQRRAVEQYLISGHLDQGLDRVRTVLGAIHMQFPPTPRRALASVLWTRSRLRLRGLSFRQRDVSEISVSELSRIDICWSIALGLAVCDNIRGIDFQTRALLMALHAGDPYRICRSLASEATAGAIAGSRAARRSARVLARASALATSLDEPYLVGLVTGASGMVAIMEGRFRAAWELCSSSEGLFRERCTGVAWELDTMQIFGLWSLFFLGEIGELYRRASQKLVEAQEERGDLYAATNFRIGAPNLAWLLCDGPEVARRQSSEAMARWSQQGVHVQHAFDLFSQAHLDLYEGCGQTAYQRILARWADIRSVFLLKIQMVRVPLEELRGRTALAAAIAKPAERRKLLGETASMVRRLRREKVGYAGAMAQLLHAALVSVGEDPQAALPLFDQAAEALAAADMKLHATCARRRRAELAGDAASVRGCDDWMRGERVLDPARTAAMLVPGVRA